MRTRENWIRLLKRRDQGFEFAQTKPVEITTYATIPRDEIDRVTSQNGDRVNFERLETPRPTPKETLKNWAKPATPRKWIWPTGNWCRQLQIWDVGTHLGYKKSARIHSHGPELWKKKVRGEYNSNWKIQNWFEQDLYSQRDLAKENMIFALESSQAIFEMGDVELIELTISMKFGAQHVYMTFSKEQSLRMRQTRLGDDTTYVNTPPHTSHFLVQLHAHACLKSCVCRARITCHDSSSSAHVFVLTLVDHSTFLSLLTIFSHIILYFLLPVNFIFQDVVDKFPVDTRWSGPWHSCRVRPSHKLWVQRLPHLGSCRRRAYHTQNEGLSSVSHDRTERPVVKPFDSLRKWADQGFSGTTKRADSRWLSSRNSKTRIPVRL